MPNPPVFPDSTGHIDAWPLPIRPNERRGGSIEEEFVAPNWIFKRLRDRGAEVIQYKHVRAGVSGISVKAANWIPVDEVRVIANGFTSLAFDTTTVPR